MADTPEQKPAPDWERIESDYRAGILSLREIAEPYAISHTAIKKRADREGWTRDLTAKIRAKAEALVSKDAVSSSGNAETKATEKEIVDANAELVANVDRRHKGMTKRGMALVDKLFGEIELTTDNLADFEKLGELLDETEVTESGRVKEDKLNKIYRAVISMGGRVDSLKKLAETFEKFAKFERVAYRLEDGEPPDTTPPEGLALDNETARRIAFILSKGLRVQKGQS